MQRDDISSFQNMIRPNLCIIDKFWFGGKITGLLLAIPIYLTHHIVGYIALGPSDIKHTWLSRPDLCGISSHITIH